MTITFKEDFAIPTTCMMLALKHLYTLSHTHSQCVCAHTHTLSLTDHIHLVTWSNRLALQLQLPRMSTLAAWATTVEETRHPHRKQYMWYVERLAWSIEKVFWLVTRHLYEDLCYMYRLAHSDAGWFTKDFKATHLGATCSYYCNCVSYHTRFYDIDCQGFSHWGWKVLPPLPPPLSPPPLPPQKKGKREREEKKRERGR